MGKIINLRLPLGPAAESAVSRLTRAFPAHVSIELDAPALGGMIVGRFRWYLVRCEVLWVQCLSVSVPKDIETFVVELKVSTDVPARSSRSQTLTLSSRIPEGAFIVQCR